MKVRSLQIFPIGADHVTALYLLSLSLTLLTKSAGSFL